MYVHEILHVNSIPFYEEHSQNVYDSWIYKRFYTKNLIKLHKKSSLSEVFAVKLSFLL